MTGRVKIIRVTTEIKAGRKEPTTQVFYECWCDVQSLGTNEKYTALSNAFTSSSSPLNSMSIFMSSPPCQNVTPMQPHDISQAPIRYL